MADNNRPKPLASLFAFNLLSSQRHKEGPSESENMWGSGGRGVGWVGVELALERNVKKEAVPEC